MIHKNVQMNVDARNNLMATLTRASLNALHRSLLSYCFQHFSPSNPARSKWGPTGCRVLVKRCNPKIMSDYDTLSLTSWDSPVTPLTEKKPLPMPSAVLGFVGVRKTPSN